MSEPIYTEQKIMDKVSKCDLPTLQKMMPDIKKEAIKTGDPSLALPLQAQRLLPMDQNHGLSKDQVAYMATDKGIAEEVKKSPDLGKLLNPLRYNLSLTNITLEFNPGKNDELTNSLSKNLYLLASPFLTERIASAIRKYSKESKDAVAQKEKTDKQIYKNMDQYVNLMMLNRYSVLSPMFLKNIMNKTIMEMLNEEINIEKEKMAAAEKEGNKIEVKKTKNELESLMRLADPESLPHIYLQLIAQGIVVPPKHVKLNLEKMPEPGKLMLAAKDMKKGLKAVLPPFIRYTRLNEKKIVKDLTEAMEKFRQA